MVKVDCNVTLDMITTKTLKSFLFFTTRKLVFARPSVDASCDFVVKDVVFTPGEKVDVAFSRVICKQRARDAISNFLN